MRIATAYDRCYASGFAIMDGIILEPWNCIAELAKACRAKKKSADNGLHARKYDAEVTL